MIKKKNEDQGSNEIILKNVCDETGERSTILPNSVLEGRTFKCSSFA